VCEPAKKLSGAAKMAAEFFRRLTEDQKGRPSSLDMQRRE
jgi:hypothetical protein